MRFSRFLSSFCRAFNILDDENCIKEEKKERKEKKQNEW